MMHARSPLRGWVASRKQVYWSFLSSLCLCFLFLLSCPLPRISRISHGSSDHSRDGTWFLSIKWGCGVNYFFSECIHFDAKTQAKKLSNVCETEDPFSAESGNVPHLSERSIIFSNGLSFDRRRCQHRWTVG